jgi:hypothetical protein
MSLWLRLLLEVLRSRAKARRGLAFAAAHFYFLPAALPVWVNMPTNLTILGKLFTLINSNCVYL